jgi:hypothetical protein
VKKVLNKKILIATSIALIVLASALLGWYLYRYDTTVITFSYEATPIMTSPLSGTDYSWEAKAYSARIFGNSPFNGEGYIYRERSISENRFQHTEFQNLNISLKLRLQIKNATGYMLCNKTLNFTDGFNKQITFEFKPDGLKAGSTLQIKITLNLNVKYNYGESGEPKQFTLQKEWTKNIQVQQTEPEQGITF